MEEEPFKDKNGNPLQRGLYYNTLLDLRGDPNPTNVRFVTGEYVEEGGKRYVLIENYAPEDLREHTIHRLGPEDTEKLLPIPEFWEEDQLKAIIWAKAKRDGLEDKTMDLPLEESRSSTHIFMGPQQDHGPFGKHPNLKDSGYVHPDKKY